MAILGAIEKGQMAETLGEGETAQIDGNHQQVAHRLQIRTANVGAAPSGHLSMMRRT
jgi:hypothetical protein